jgi:osmotically-inducible protein OsmY
LSKLIELPEYVTMNSILSYARFLTVAFALTGCAATPVQESTGEYLDNTAISTKVKAELLNDPVVRGLSINVETFKGTVQLSGFANSVLERERAEVLARSVDGVLSVQNDVHVK